MVTTYQLDNGLKVLVKEDHRAPAVMVQVWYSVGSADEPLGLTGISHLVEHLMFQGTTKNQAGQYSEQVAEHGGELNAFTSYDFTAYHQLLPVSELPLAFDLEADRMTHLVFEQEKFKKELQVVMEERRLRTEDQPAAVAYERFLAASMVESPYQNPTVGWMSDLKQMTLKDAENWYKTYYYPQNAVVVVVGDVDPEKVFVLAKKHFGHLKGKKKSETKAHPSLNSTGPQFLDFRLPAKVPVLMMGYHAPTIRTVDQPWEAYALLVLLEILQGGKGSRLYEELVIQRQVADGVTGNYEAMARYDNLFLLEIVPSQKASFSLLLQLVDQEIAQIKEKGVSADVLQRVKARLIAQHVYQQDSLFGQALVLGALESTGLPWTLEEQYVDTIQAITAEQIMAVAQKYLTEDRLVIGKLIPIVEERHG